MKIFHLTQLVDIDYPIDDFLPVRVSLLVVVATHAILIGGSAAHRHYDRQHGAHTDRQPTKASEYDHFLLLMMGMGFYFSRRNNGSDKFFKGGGSIPWWAAGIAFFVKADLQPFFFSIILSIMFVIIRWDQHEAMCLDN